MVTTKKTAAEYTQKEMKSELKHFTTKNQLNTKEYNNAVNEGQKSYKVYRKQIANGKSKSLIISNYFKCKTTNLSNQKKRGWQNK